MTENQDNFLRGAVLGWIVTFLIAFLIFLSIIKCSNHTFNACEQVGSKTLHGRNYKIFNCNWHSGDIYFELKGEDESKQNRNKKSKDSKTRY